MIQLTPIDIKHPQYSFVENLLEEAFPENERRDKEEQRRYTAQNKLFTCYLIEDKESNLPIGLVTIWNLNGFHYIEHLATSPKCRNKGYGKDIMKALTDMLPGTIVLEVEHPEDEWSKRRIGFYQRCGFSLCHKDYIQPPYRKGGEEVPLYLMFTHTETIDKEFDTIRHQLYKEVYGVE